MRARLTTLAGRAEEWADHVRRWMELTAPLVTDDGPDDAERYLVLQTLVGAWPIDAERLEEYLRKALREAKRTTSWVEPDEAREAAVIGFATDLLDRRPFLDAFLPFAAEVAAEGAEVARAMTLLKLTSPGRARRVPGRRAGGPVPGGPRQPPPGRLGAPPARPWPTWTPGPSRPRPRPSSTSCAGCWPSGPSAPTAFAGAYRALDAGPATCAFTRGDDEVLVVVAVRPRLGGATVTLPSGTWAPVVGPSSQVGGGVPHPVAALLGGHRCALWVAETATERAD